MKTFLKLAGIAGLVAAATVAPLSADAGEPHPAEKQAIVTDLNGKARAITYWVRGADGLEVITTIDAAPADANEAPAIVRVSAVLQPGQHQVISVPGELGRQGAALRIQGTDDGIAVEKVAALSY
jgi:hypothetical protein